MESFTLKSLCAEAPATFVALVDASVFAVRLLVSFQVVRPGETYAALRAKQFISLISHTLPVSSDLQSSLSGHDRGLKKGFPAHLLETSPFGASLSQAFAPPTPGLGCL